MKLKIKNNTHNKIIYFGIYFEKEFREPQDFFLNREILAL